MFGSRERSLTCQCIISYYILTNIKKGDETKISTQQYIKLNTGAKEIQQLNVCLLIAHNASDFYGRPFAKTILVYSVFLVPVKCI